MTLKKLFVRRAVLVGLLLVGLPAGAEPLHLAIDRLVAARADGPLAGRSDDEEFLRRITLDFTGLIPTAVEVRTFLDDGSKDKRTRLVDRLLATEAFADHWTDRLSVMLLERQNLGKISDEDWRDFLKRTLAGQPKWDELVAEVIAASGKGEARPAMRFLGKGDPDRLTEDIARIFLGMDLKCAKCHDHPSVDEWKQVHYWGLYAYLNQTKLATNSKDKQGYFVENLATNRVDFQSVFSDEKQSTGPRLPDREEVAIPQFEEGQEFEQPAADGLPAVPKFRPREHLSRDMISPDNAHFVRNSVNRIWFLLMGRGLSHPLDEVNGDNPPSHPELMKLLAREFVAHEFDVKWMLREIVLSEAYQRSSRLPDGVDSVDPARFRTSLSKGLTPEELLDAILQATGNRKQVMAFEPAPDATKFDRRGYFSGTHENLPGVYDEIRAIFVQTFGRAAGVPEVDFSPGANQSLFLMNDRLLMHWLEPGGGNLMDRLGRMEDASAIAEELYLCVLARFPTDAERRELADYLNQQESRHDAALGDLAWALLNSTEFRLNH